MREVRLICFQKIQSTQYISFYLIIAFLIVSCTIGPPPKKHITNTDKEAIGKVVKENVKELRICYERLAQRDSKASGRVDLNWTIQPNGIVGDVKVVKSEIKDEDTLECMIASLATWKFSKPLKGVVLDVNYPFVFVRSEEEKKEKKKEKDSSTAL